MKRINWIDWAKFFAITLMVMGHIPMEKGHPLILHIGFFCMPLFMFVSGYLTKRQSSMKENIMKDMKMLVLPFFIYNIIFYPYWFVKMYVADQVPLSLCDYAFTPALGVLSFSFLGPLLNGPTWFLVALLMSHVIIDIGSRLRFKYLFWGLFAVVCFAFDAFNEEYLFTLNRTIFGFARFFPFYLAGYILRGRIKAEAFPLKMIVSMLVLAVLLFLWLPQLLGSNLSILCKAGLLFVEASVGIVGAICLSLLLNPSRIGFVKNVSIGTLVIFGLHWMLIGTTNFVLEKLLHVTDITYSPWQVLALACLFEALLYPLIKILPPVMLGKRKEIKAQLNS